MSAGIRKALPLLAVLSAGVAAGEPTAGDRFFESKVRPVLVAQCFECHAGKKTKGGLRVDSAEALAKGGNNGPAVVAKDPAASLLIAAIRHDGRKMPPKGKLSDAEIADLTAWVKMGAPWPGGDTTATAAGTARRPGQITDADRAYWAWKPPAEPAIPADAFAGWSRDPIDRFIAARLRAEGLAPAPEAERPALIRRVYFDMIGLPPTPAEVDAFVADKSPDAYEKLVDGLLRDARYGQRWARHWLDLVRYADSDGYRIDDYRPDIWRYRDYVVRSLNDDKPYARFVQEQLAGDELFPGDPDALTATGYLRHTIYEYNARDARGQWTTILNDVTDTTADVFLGLGLQCARCHDHKFDPVLQKDYFRLQAFFGGLLPREGVIAATDEQRRLHKQKSADWEARTADIRKQIDAIEAPYRKKAAHDAIIKFPDDIQAMINKPVAERTTLEHQLAELAYRQVDYEYDRLERRFKGDDKTAVLALRKQLAEFDKIKPAPLPVVTAAVDAGPKAAPTTIPGRSAAGVIEPGFPTVIDPAPAAITPPAGLASTGRRAALANWISRPDNALTMRVIVNRIWQYHFGRGLAANASDFGKLGEPPSHPELLDLLTGDFVRGGGRFKALHRRILLSATYRQSAHNPKAEACRLKDPENRLHWRHDVRRLDAEQIRDAVLSVTGELDAAAGGPGADPSGHRRSIYTRVMRNNRDAFLDVFDLPQFFNSAASRDTTTTPVQSLLLINSQTLLLRSASLAKRLEREAGRGSDAAAQVNAAYRLVYGRAATAEELSAALRFLDEQSARINPAETGSAEAAFLHDKLPFRDGQAAVLTPGGKQTRLDVPHHEAMPTGEFTIEAFFRINSIYESAAVRTIVAKWDGKKETPGWGFGVTGKGSRRKPQTLVLQIYGRKLDGTFGEEAVFSDQHIALNKPYYAAVTVKLAAGEPAAVTFYVKDLSNDDEPMLTAKLTHRIKGEMGNKLPLTIGGRPGAGGAAFDGLIDDVRLSKAALPSDKLLYSAEGVRADTVGYWQFESKPNVFHDSAGHGLNIRTAAGKAGSVDQRRAALADLCHVLLNSNEFLYVE